MQHNLFSFEDSGPGPCPEAMRAGHGIPRWWPQEYGPWPGPAVFISATYAAGQEFISRPTPPLALIDLIRETQDLDNLYNLNLDKFIAQLVTKGWLIDSKPDAGPFRHWPDLDKRRFLGTLQAARFVFFYDYKVKVECRPSALEFSNSK